MSENIFMEANFENCIQIHIDKSDSDSQQLWKDLSAITHPDRKNKYVMWIY
jgi:hypothetical protein